MERHKRTEHIIIGGHIDIKDAELNQPIYPRTGFENDESYKEEVEDHWNNIRAYKKEDSFDMEVNKILNPDFTYIDLRHTIKDIAHELNHTFKINIGFGFILRQIVTGTDY